MTVLQITPTGAVYRPAWDTSGAALSIVGDPPQWNPFDDSSYTEHSGTGSDHPAPISAFDAYPTVVSVDLGEGIYIRQQQIEEDAGAQPDFRWLLRGISDGAILATGQASGTTLGISQLNLPVDTITGDPVARIATGDLAVEVSHGPSPFSTEKRFRTYDVVLTITIDDAAVIHRSPLRRYPVTHRLYPPPPTRRAAGGYR